jgi:choline dehydrogenase-like flavoprotein
MLRENFTRTVHAVGHTTSLPVETNNISLDPNVKDAWGLPAMRVTYRDHAEDLKTMQFFQERCKELLQAAGASKQWNRPVREQSFGYHLLGTCRMGDEAKNSVVDKYHRAHDVPNLFICDGSSFVTSGRGQPTLTIQALAYRASDHITRMAKSGEIKSAI